jgi:hypothetical protein
MGALIVFTSDDQQIMRIPTSAQLDKLYAWNPAEIERRRNPFAELPASAPTPNMKFYEYWKKLGNRAAIVVPGPRGPDYPEEGIVTYPDLD